MRKAGKVGDGKERKRKKWRGEMKRRNVNRREVQCRSER
jgi:hypothetical protein